MLSFFPRPETPKKLEEDDDSPQKEIVAKPEDITHDESSQPQMTDSVKIDIS
jgi:hypothetical protein